MALRYLKKQLSQIQEKLKVFYSEINAK